MTTRLRSDRVTSLKVLFIGGTGVISSACAQRAVDLGIDLYVLNRKQTSTRPLPAEAHVLQGDIRDAASARQAIGSQDFDVVVDFVAFTPEQVQSDIDLFTDRTGQYVFISSASAYQTPPRRQPIIESSPLRNPIWSYSQAKIACEELLVKAYREDGFPATIVRPAHTYDRTSIPLEGKWTTIDRMRRGKEVVVHGDGSSLWTLTHHRDFAHAFVGLLGNTRAVGDSFHITSDDALTWDQIYSIMADAAGVQAHIVHVASDTIAAVEPSWGPPLLGDKTHCLTFDNSKVRDLVPDFVASIPFEQGAREIIDWYDADPARQQVDADTDRIFDQLVTFATSPQLSVLT
jgi:nucleoside-diphosphate-sugar epimerase